MIVSHSKRFIFIKTKKTAGSSVEIALSRHCGSADIVLPISAEEDEFREREYGVQPANFEYLPPRPAHSLPFGVIEGAFADPRGFLEFLRHPGSRPFPWKRKRYSRHMRAKDLRGLMDEWVWENYRKVTIERNPWDKAVSRYYWDLHFGGRVNGRSLEEHIEFLAEKDPIQLSNWRIYAENRRILVDHVILYENLVPELRKLGNDLGIDCLELPAYRAKGNSRKDKRPAAEVLSDNAKSIVAQVCANEIEAFGYLSDGFGQAANPVVAPLPKEDRETVVVRGLGIENSRCGPTGSPATAGIVEESAAARWRRVLPGLVVIAALVAMADYQYPGHSEVWSHYWAAVCLVVSLAGVIVRAATAGFSSEFPYLADQPDGPAGRVTLDTMGLYSIVRNPRCLGAFLIGLGVILMVHVWWLTAIYVVAYWFYYQPKIRLEENALQAWFGGIYKAWAFCTPRWLPAWRRLDRPSRRFSWKRAFAAEYNLFFAVILVMFLMEMLGDWSAVGTVDMEREWVALVVLCFIFWLIQGLSRKPLRT